MNRWTGLLGGALLMIGIVAVVIFGNLRAQREHNAQLLARITALEGAHVPATIGHAAPLAAINDSAALAATIAPESPAQSGAAAAGQAESLLDMIRQTMESQEGQDFRRTMAVMNLRQQHPDLAKALGLAEEEVDRLIEMLARHDTAIGIRRAGVAAGGHDAASRQELMRGIAEQEQSHEAEVEAMLGNKYMQWKDYQRMSAARQREAMQHRQVEQLRTAVSVSGRPVQQAQFDALRAALQAEERRIQVETRGASTRQQLERQAEDHRRLVDVAAAHLDPLQLEGYRRHLQQQSDLMRAIVGAGAMDAGGGGRAAPRAAD